VPGPRSAAVLTALLLARVALAADPRATFHATKSWVDFSSAGVVVRELWLPVEGTALTLVHAVRTSPADPKLEGALFAVDTKTGDEWSGSVETDLCQPLYAMRTLTVLYRQGGVVVVRLGQGDAKRKPFATCGELYRAGDLGACRSGPRPTPSRVARRSCSTARAGSRRRRAASTCSGLRTRG
jgi:hypothetical protein